MPDRSAPPLPGYREDQRSFFDTRITRDWSAYSNPVWDASRRLEVEELFRHVTPRTVLDVGCGCGFHDVVIAEQPGVELVEGIDSSETTIDVAEREYPHPAVRRRVADIRSEPDGAFDLVVSFQVIEHLRDQVGFLAACARQARPGGWVAVATPNRRRLDNRVRRALGREETLIAETHFRELSQAELEETAAAAGLRPRASLGYGLTFTIPRLNRQVVPPMRGIRLGLRLPALANVIVTVFDRP